MKYDLVTDGSSLAYARCGGWAFLLQGSGNEKRRSGILWNADSNILELWAIVEGLSIISKPSDVTIFTDSYYVINGYLKDKYAKQFLWRELYLLAVIHNLNFVKVGKGKSDKRHTKAHHMARETVFNAVRADRFGEQLRRDSEVFPQASHKVRNRGFRKRRHSRRVESYLEDAG